MQAKVVSYYFWTNVLVISICFQIHFMLDHHSKTKSESFDTLEICRVYLMFFQGVYGALILVDLLNCLTSALTQERVDYC